MINEKLTEASLRFLRSFQQDISRNDGDEAG